MMHAIAAAVLSFGLVATCEPPPPPPPVVDGCPSGVECCASGTECDEPTPVPPTTTLPPGECLSGQECPPPPTTVPPVVDECYSGQECQPSGQP